MVVDEEVEMEEVVKVVEVEDLKMKVEEVE